MDYLRYPIGQFESFIINSHEDRNSVIQQIPKIVQTVRSITCHLQPEQLSVPYRQGGWTIKQIIHHLADNDINAFLRFKKALTEDEPLASSYREDLWAQLSDYNDAPIECSLLLLESLHIRFLYLLSSLESEQFNRKLKTQVLGIITLDVALQRFIWHNHHHIAQIKSLIDRMEWDYCHNQSTI
ncbi:YfiT family bacillithiol transferase [Paenibacillus sp. L3-i20]|uniref:YfiT family bacillithiol transferase n=1 Tax=Paenibacillus sp. L3-i20 TaxID=2905833 RepID=UPI001EDF2A6A|nr:putative metal-dependent hydrolase [Paenibacillus sp. L3-i20]GKU79170.1 putative metal-dependent hydrolase [Paenibacillus sp. L3-i20]